jgi:DNA polymerase-1
MKNDKKKQLFIIDGYGLIYRSYFAFINRPMTDLEGNNISAIFGFFRMFFSIINKSVPTYLAVAMDSLTPTFRHELYEEYKATREKTPEDLHAQIPIIEQMLEAAGVPVLREDGLEADDLIASLAGKTGQMDVEAVIVSSDKDLLQLISPSVSALRPVKKDMLWFDRERVFEEFGIYPEQVVDYLALIGDSADNIPGVKGIGPKGAVKLLSTYPSLEEIYEHLDEQTPAVRKKLEQSREQAFLSQKLAQLHKEAEVCCDLEKLSVGNFKFEKMEQYFLKINSKSLAKEAASYGGGNRKQKAPKSSMQPDLFGSDDDQGAPAKSGPDPELTGEGVYHTVTGLPELGNLIEKLREAGLFAFDSETDSLDEMVARPVGFSFCCNAREAYYLPLIAGGKQVLDPEDVKRMLRSLLEDPDVRVVGQNIKYDYKVLKRWGIEIANCYFDTMIAAWLLDAGSGQFGMDALARQYLDYTPTSYKEVVPSGSIFSDIQLEKAAAYAAEDADITFRLFTLFSAMIESRGMNSLLFELEMPVLGILAEMELKGMHLIRERLEEYGKEIQERIEKLEQQIFTECGREFNINSTKQLQEVLFEQRSLSPAKKTKTGYSTDTSVLEELAKVDVVPQWILERRGLVKLKNTYIDALPALINPETGRIHTSFLQTGTATGRLSSRNPNLQNIPIRSKDGRMIRSAFVPSEGRIFLSADYAQIELVVLAHVADDPGLKEAFLTGVDVHRHTGSLIFDVPLEQVTDQQRRIAKTINFGVMYGMSAFRLSRELDIPRKQASQFIDAYFSRYSGIRSFMDRIVYEAEKTGKVSTMLGHERIIGAITSRNKTEKAGAERIAVNTPIQGTAADIMKKAMITVTGRLRKAGLHADLILQVHDELIFEVDPAEVEEVSAAVRDEMERVVELNVPLHVSIETGSSWGEMH